MDFEAVEQYAAKEANYVEGDGEALRCSEYKAEGDAHEPGVEIYVNFAYFFHQSFGAGIVIVEDCILDCCGLDLLFGDLMFLIFLASAICRQLLLRFVFLVSNVDASLDEFDGEEHSYYAQRQ